jgi:hypothetical protein
MNGREDRTSIDELQAARRGQNRDRELERAWALTMRLRAMGGVSQRSQPGLEPAAAPLAA